MKFKRKKTLKAQLQFRKVVSKQEADRLCFQIGEKGKPYAVDKSADNVKKLIKEAMAAGTEQSENMFCGKKYKNYQILDNVRTPFFMDG